MNTHTRDKRAHRNASVKHQPTVDPEEVPESRPAQISAPVPDRLDFRPDGRRPDVDPIPVMEHHAGHRPVAPVRHDHKQRRLERAQQRRAPKARDVEHERDRRDQRGDPAERARHRPGHRLGDRSRATVVEHRERDHDPDPTRPRTDLRVPGEPCTRPEERRLDGAHRPPGRERNLPLLPEQIPLVRPGLALHEARSGTDISQPREHRPGHPRVRDQNRARDSKSLSVCGGGGTPTATP